MSDEKTSSRGGRVGRSIDEMVSGVESQEDFEEVLSVMADTVEGDCVRHDRVLQGIRNVESKLTEMGWGIPPKESDSP